MAKFIKINDYLIEIGSKAEGLLLTVSAEYANRAIEERINKGFLFEIGNDKILFVSKKSKDDYALEVK